MKNLKGNITICFLVFITILFVFNACDNNTPEQPQFREETINLLFECTVNIQGTLTQSQWNNAIDTIENAINDAYNAAGNINKDRFVSVFENPDVKIIVELTSIYITYKTIGDGITLYINVNNIKKLRDLSEFEISYVNDGSKITAAINFLFDWEIRTE